MAPFHQSLKSVSLSFLILQEQKNWLVGSDQCRDNCVFQNWALWALTSRDWHPFKKTPEAVTVSPFFGSEFHTQITTQNVVWRCASSCSSWTCCQSIQLGGPTLISAREEKDPQATLGALSPWSFWLPFRLYDILGDIWNCPQCIPNATSHPIHLHRELWCLSLYFHFVNHPLSSVSKLNWPQFCSFPLNKEQCSFRNCLVLFFLFSISWT